jgi:hypothetical protein
VESRVDRAFGQIEGAVALLVQMLCDGVAMLSARVDGCEEKKIQMSLDGVAGHAAAELTLLSKGP